MLLQTGKFVASDGGKNQGQNGFRKHRSEGRFEQHLGHEAEMPGRGPGETRCYAASVPGKSRDSTLLGCKNRKAVRISLLALGGD